MSIHDHHRKRMKAKFLELGGDGLHPHEMLEMLLYYSKPQGDTNPCAHALMERFGGWKGIFDAPIEELMAVEGVGEHTATLLRLLPVIYKNYEKEMHKKTIPYNTISRVVEYCHPLFVSLTKERLYLLLLNNRFDLIDCVSVAEGTVNKCDVLLRLISEKVHARNASYVILAHNHPDGFAVPSHSDVAITNTIFHHLRAIDVLLLEHIIFSETKFYPIIKNTFAETVADYYASSQAKEQMAGGFYNINEDIYEFPTMFEREK